MNYLEQFRGCSCTRLKAKRKLSFVTQLAKQRSVFQERICILLCKFESLDANILYTNFSELTHQFCVKSEEAKLDLQFRNHIKDLLEVKRVLFNFFLNKFFIHGLWPWCKLCVDGNRRKKGGKQSDYIGQTQSMKS